MAETRRDVLAAAAGVAAASFVARFRDISDACRRRTADVDAGAARLRDEYTVSEDVVYLNHASIGTIPKAVQDAHRKYLAVCEANPWLHIWGDAWTEPENRVVAAAAAALGCGGDEAAVIHNTTEGFNLLAHGLPLGPGDEVLFSSLNHTGASACWLAQGPRRGFATRRFPFPLEKIADLSPDQLVDIYVREISDKTRLLVVPHIDNVFGIRTPLERLAAEAKKRGVRWIAVDGAQCVGMIPVDLKKAGVDFYATSAHKWIQAPKGTGLLFVKKAAQEHLQPMITTFGQRRWRNSARRYSDYGTRDLPGVLAVGDALAFQTRLDDARPRRLKVLLDRLRDRVGNEKRLSWQSPSDATLASAVVAVGVEGGRAAALADKLFKWSGIVVRPFSGNGMNHLRVSPNLMNDTKQIDTFVDALIRLLS